MMPKGHRANIGGSAVGLPQQVSIAGMRHPAGASEMAIVDASTAFGVVCRIESEQYPNRLRPIGAIGIRVQQARVELDVRLVVGGEFLPCRCGICEGLAWECLRRYVPYQEIYSGLVNAATEAAPLSKDAEQLWGLRFRRQARPLRA